MTVQIKPLAAYYLADILMNLVDLKTVSNCVLHSMTHAYTRVSQSIQSILHPNYLGPIVHSMCHSQRIIYTAPTSDTIGMCISIRDQAKKNHFTFVTLGP